MTERTSRAGSIDFSDTADTTHPPAAMPLVVSFYAGGQYYHDAAGQLRSDCERLGLAVDIRELDVPEDADWIDICRRKIPFYRAMLLAHQRPILWVDVDTRMLRKPSFLAGCGADIGAFLRGFRYLPHFDPASSARLLTPGFLFLNHTEPTHRFLEFAESLEAASREKATDDYFLQRALEEWPGRLRFLLFSGAEVSTGPGDDRHLEAYFLLGDSGSSQGARALAAQHQPALFDIRRQKEVLKAAASEALRRRSRPDAIAFYRHICRLDREDARAYERFLDLLDKEGLHKKVAYHLARGKESPALFRAAHRFQLKRALARGGLHAGERVAAKIFQSGDLELVAFSKSRLFRYQLDERARRIGAEKHDRVPLWWMETPYPGNLGDVLSPYIVERLTGVPPRFTSKGDRVLAVGSILRFAGPDTMVWGSGSPSTDLAPDPEARYCAVRGPLTRELVLAAGGRCPEVYGDPAWVLPWLFAPNPAKTTRLGLVRHYIHRDIPIALGEGVREIEILRCGPQEIEAFITELCSCQAILSTSLHGFILAQAYGIPARLCTLSAGRRPMHGDGLKFRDYRMSVGLEAMEPLDLSGLSVVDASLGEQCEDEVARPIEVDRLLEAAPFSVRC